MISEKCKTTYAKLNTFVTNVINRDVTPKISNLNTEVWGSDTQNGNSRIDTLNTNVNSLNTSITNMTDTIYPIGSIYMSVNDTNPSVLFGGTWERIKDRFLLSAGDNYSNGATGGSATVTLTASQSGVPAHSHKYNDYNTTYTLKTTNRKPGTSTAVAYGTSLTSGGGATERTSSNNTAANASQAHENMPPYLAVYMWKRVG